MKIVAVLLLIALLYLVFHMTKNYFSKEGRKERKHVNNMYAKFLEASDEKNINDIEYFGSKLASSKYVTPGIIDRITEIIDTKFSDQQQLKKLRLALYMIQVNHGFC